MLRISSIAVNQGGACALGQANWLTPGSKIWKTWFCGWSCSRVSKNATKGKSRLFLFCGLIACLCPTASGQQAKPPRTISVVTDDNYPPYVFRDRAGTVQGITIDQWRAWEKMTGVTAEIHAMDWGEAVKRMKAGEFDVIDTVFETVERSVYLDFSRPYATLQVPIFFRESISGINDVASLKGFPVAVKAGDSVEQQLRDNGIGPLLLYKNYEAIITAANGVRR